MKIITFKVFPVFLSALFVLFNACTSSESDNSIPIKKGRYNFTLNDSAGNNLIAGEMMFSKITKQKDVGEDNYVIEGSYTVTKVNTDTTYKGFSTMNGGELKGYYNAKSKMININTNPRIADANVFLNGKVTGTSITGGWNYSTFRGVGNEAGKFDANYIKP
ncbi:MAG: hypothetical protein IT280_08175 [Ignavibacteria bacterium]|nr:hypothetical protein [Ignavibacteria bacterium]